MKVKEILEDDIIEQYDRNHSDFKVIDPKRKIRKNTLQNNTRSALLCKTVKKSDAQILKT